MRRAVVITGVGLVEAPTPEALAADVAGLSETHLRHADRVGLLAVAAARRALADARLLPAPEDLGLSFGVGFGTYDVNARHQRRILEEGIAHASPAEFTLTLPNMTAAFVSIAFGIRGETTTFADGTLAGATAFGAALDRIRAGSGPILVGGAESLSPDVVAALEATGLRSPGAWPEFGAGLILEAADRAAQRGARPRAVVAGYGAGADLQGAIGAAARDAGAPAPDARDPDETPSAYRLATHLANAGAQTLAFAPACFGGARAIILRAP